MSMFNHWKEDAREEGREEATLDIAVNLLSMGLPLEQIAEVTKLSIEKIQSLVPSA